MKILNKKAAISIEFIMILIILVVSFAVILLFYYAFDWKGEIDKEACHQSVIYKATVPNMFEQKVVEIPLNCKTEKICISDSSRKGACDSEYAGEKYQTIDLKETDEIKRNEEINKIIAEKLYECWWMMGQGKVQLYSRNFLEKKTCVICTRIVFDKELKIEKVPGLLTYLKNNKIPNSQLTYWQFLENSNSNNIYGLNKSTDVITTKPHAIVFAEVDADAWKKWTTRGIGTAGGAVAGAYVGGIIGSIVPGPGNVIGAGVGGIIGFLGTGEISNKIDDFFHKDKILPAWLFPEYNVTDLKELQCASFDGKL